MGGMRTSALLFAVTVLSGCVGEVDPVGGTGTSDTAGSARQAFDQDVYPIVSGMCTSCHATTAHVTGADGFVDPVAATAYTTATGFTDVVGDFSSSAPILTKIAAGHNNLTYTTDDLTKITAWLAKEVDERGSTGHATATPIAAWSGCMNYGDFQSANMAQTWGNMMTVENPETCASCHVNGESGFIATPQNQYFFNTITQHSLYLGQYFRVDSTTDPANPKVIVNTNVFDAVSQGVSPHLEHPLFDATNNDGMPALSAFYQLIVARQAAGLCEPPTLVD